MFPVQDSEQSSQVFVTECLYFPLCIHKQSKHLMSLEQDGSYEGPVQSVRGRRPNDAALPGPIQSRCHPVDLKTHVRSSASCLTVLTAGNRS